MSPSIVLISGICIPHFHQRLVSFMSLQNKPAPTILKQYTHTLHTFQHETNYYIIILATLNRPSLWEFEICKKNLLIYSNVLSCPQR